MADIILHLSMAVRTTGAKGRGARAPLTSKAGGLSPLKIIVKSVNTRTSVNTRF